MSKAKWFAVRNPSTSETVATSANQIMPLHEISQRYKIVLNSPDPPFLWRVEGLGTRLACIQATAHSHGHITHDVMIYLSCSMVQCSMDTLKFVCTWHGGISGAKLSVKVCSGKICNVARQSELYYRAHLK